jgi:hypothetical protein
MGKVVFFPIKHKQIVTEGDDTEDVEPWWTSREVGEWWFGTRNRYIHVRLFVRSRGYDQFHNGEYFFVYPDIESTTKRYDRFIWIGRVLLNLGWPKSKKDSRLNGYLDKLARVHADRQDDIEMVHS